MNKPQPNEEPKINADLQEAPNTTEKPKIELATHGLNQPRPEIVEACLAMHSTGGKHKPHATPKGERVAAGHAPPARRL